MRILGIDQSYTSTGVVIFSDINKIEKVMIISSNKKDDVFKRSWDIANTICDIAVLEKIDKIGIEGLAFGMRGDATRDLAGLQFMIVNLLQFTKGFKVSILPPTTIKKFATGSGRAKKDEMYDSLEDEVKDIFKANGFKKSKGLYDVTDAYFIAKYLYAMGGE